MTENKKTVPQVDENLKAEILADTTPHNAEKEIIIPIKFNKEVKELTLSQAAELAQKGMKFDLISEDYERLKKISRISGKSVPEFLNQLETVMRSLPSI